MRQIKKHQFEPVSLLTVENGILETAIIPASNQPDWLVPKSLILAIDDYRERIWTYLWQNQEVAVYHLTPKSENVDKLVVLEGNSDVHRIALQTHGEIRYKNLRISDVKDGALTPQEKETIVASVPQLPGSDDALEFIYQAVNVEGVVYLVPELDLIVNRLVDLDS